MLLILCFFLVPYFTYPCCNLYYFLLSAGLEFSFLFVARLLNWNLVLLMQVIVAIGLPLCSAYAASHMLWYVLFFIYLKVC